MEGAETGGARGGTISRRRLLRTAATGAGASFVVGTALGSRPVARDEWRSQSTGEEADVLREDVWVETGTDTDGTGQSDRVHVEIARPRSTTDGELPVIVRPDPYRIPDPERVHGSRDLPHDLGELHETMEVELYRPGESGTGGSAVGRATTAIDGSTPAPDGATTAAHGSTPAEVAQRDRYFYETELLPEGYAFAYVSPIGSSLSTGCNTLGGPAEVASVASVVDWLNGRASAFDARDGGTAVAADWTAGTTGMIGGSYRGALANAVATTGVEGLETIVPIRAISSWYTYLRSSGAVISPGDEGPSSPGNAAALSAGLTTRRGGHRCDDVIAEIADRLDRDTGNYNEFFEERDYVTDVGNVSASVLVVHGLYDVEVRPRNAARWIEALQRHDVPTRIWLHRGGHGEPRDRHPDSWLELVGQWFDHWLRGEQNGVMDGPTAIVEREDGSLEGYDDWPDPEVRPTPLHVGPDGEEFGRLPRSSVGEPSTEALVDDSDVPPTRLLGTDAAEHRLVYRTELLETAVRLSGTVTPRLEVSFDSPAALLSVALVDYGPDEATIVNRGWANPQNRESLERSLAIEPGTPYRVEFPLQPVDYVFEPEHRIGIVVYSSDYNVTKRPPNAPELTLHLQESSILLPVVGGESALAEALEGGTADDEGSAGGANGDDGSGGDDDDGTDTGRSDDVPGFGILGGLAGLGGWYLLRGGDGGDDS